MYQEDYIVVLLMTQEDSQPGRYSNPGFAAKASEHFRQRPRNTATSPHLHPGTERRPNHLHQPPLLIVLFISFVLDSVSISPASLSVGFSSSIGIASNIVHLQVGWRERCVQHDFDVHDTPVSGTSIPKVRYSSLSHLQKDRHLATPFPPLPR